MKAVRFSASATRAHSNQRAAPFTARRKEDSQKERLDDVARVTAGENCRPYAADRSFAAIVYETHPALGHAKLFDGVKPMRELARIDFVAQ